MQEPSGHAQPLAFAYHVERMQGGRGVRCLGHELLLVHRMKPVPRGHPRGVTIRSVHKDR